MKKKMIKGLMLLSAAALAFGVGAGTAGAQTINILTDTDTGTTVDGTFFSADPNPSLPSTGTGVFNPFVRVQTNGSGGLQNGFNTDAQNHANFDTKTGTWTHSVLFGSLTTVTMNGNSYYELTLDANQVGPAGSIGNRIDITDLQIYIGSDPNLANPEAVGSGPYGNGFTGTTFTSGAGGLLGLSPVWALDNGTNGDVTVVLQSSICDTPGKCGSGHGDMDLLIPTSLLGSHAPTEYFVFYSEYAVANSGFEEWSVLSAPSQVPEPSTLLLLGSGFLGLAAYRRFRK